MKDQGIPGLTQSELERLIETANLVFVSDGFHDYKKQKEGISYLAELIRLAIRRKRFGWYFNARTLSFTADTPED